MNKHRIFLCLLAMLLLTLRTTAQISGAITDVRNGKPLEGVTVFLNNTTRAYQSDASGQFILTNPTPGFQEIVLFKKGYELYRATMRIQSERAYNLKLSLTPTKKSKSVHPSASEVSLIQTLISGTNHSDQIDFLNADELSVLKSTGVFAPEVCLSIQNNTLGYRMYFYLSGIPVGDLSSTPIRYEELPAAELQQTVTWESNRKANFEGTLRHWLLSLTSDHVEGHYTLTTQQGDTIAPSKLLSKSSLPDYTTLNIGQPLDIHYSGSHIAQATSHIQTEGSVEVSSTGVLLNARALTVNGAMHKKGLGWQLPTDYMPITGDVEDAYAQTLNKLVEKIYVHTDKPYYYPGEPLWFKGYINYAEPAWRDSLSRVVYAEIITPDNKVLLSKQLRIDSGTFHNDFILPDTLKAGLYHLRAYTNLNRNFGDSSLFMKAIPLLHITDKVDYSAATTMLTTDNTGTLKITSDKQVYHTREKITLTIQTQDEKGNPIAANLSVAVTDAIQVIPVTQSQTITREFNQQASNSLKKIKSITELKFLPEYGVGFRGQFLNDNNKPEKTDLTILQVNPHNTIFATADDKGFFYVTGLNFYDSATFTFKSDQAKEKPYGKIELLERDRPQVITSKVPLTLPTQQTQSPQRIISEFEVPTDARVLQNVEVFGRKIDEESHPDYRTKRPYGKPDYVLKAKDINTSMGNLLFSLQGRFPGLIIGQPTNGEWTVFTRRGISSSINNVNEVLVMIDNVPMSGRPGVILSSINPETVESVEFTNKINVLYGSSSAFGVIAVFTKNDFTQTATGKSNHFQTLRVMGFAPQRKFISPDHGAMTPDKTNADYRSTVYWNPLVSTNSKTGTATLSFYAADLPASYHIVIEGVDLQQNPMRMSTFVEIQDR